MPAKQLLKQLFNFFYTHFREHHAVCFGRKFGTHFESWLLWWKSLLVDEQPECILLRQSRWKLQKFRNPFTTTTTTTNELRPISKRGSTRLDVSSLYRMGFHLLIEILHSFFHSYLYFEFIDFFTFLKRYFLFLSFSTFKLIRQILTV